LNGPAAESLREAGVRIRPVKPATGGANRIVLPIAAGLDGSDTTLLTHRGGIVLSAPDGRQAKLAKPRLLIGKRSFLSARLGGGEIDFFKVLGHPTATADPVSDAVELNGLRLKLTRAGARAIAARLSPLSHTRRRSGPTKPPLAVRPGRFATLSARATGLLATGGSNSPSAGGQAQQSTGCSLPSGAGPVPEDPLPVATRLPGAVDVTAATIEWQVRESFIRYIATGEGTSVFGGASADPPVLLPGASAPLSYGFRFPFATGWHDAGANPADTTDDTAAIEFGGAVRFLYSAHGIDLTTAEPELEIAGARSRAIFAISESGGAAERQVLVNLDLSRAAKIEASGNTYTYERVPGAIPAGTAGSIFAGFYAPGTEFGCFTVSYTAG
ncbi:MAG: HtaA domain-containing protein, partial [Solirubrobacterales bacterium]